MEEITGQFIGGPIDGNLVTASVRTIPIIESVEMWLDGAENSCSRIITKGEYVWNEDKGYFTWHLAGSIVV